jgi:hypothetical protein
MESPNALLPFQIHLAVIIFHLLPWNAQQFHFLKDFISSYTTPQRITRIELSWPSTHC